jgi:hypothetical protein
MFIYERGTHEIRTRYAQGTNEVWRRYSDGKVLAGRNKKAMKTSGTEKTARKNIDQRLKAEG